MSESLKGIEILKPNYENLYRNAINNAQVEGDGLLVLLLEYALRMYQRLEAVKAKQ